jgi:hypothetical protein
MQAIVTKHLGPTNTKGDRIKATSCGGFSVTVPYEYGLDSNGAHCVAAVALCKYLKWDFDHVDGSLPDGSIAWVKIPR